MMNDYEFKKLYELYSKYIFSYILKLVNYNKDLAEEILQESFLQIFISLDKFKGNSDIKTWMCKIAKNICFKYFRKNKKQISFDNIDECTKIIEDIERSPEDIYLKKEQKTILLQLIMQLRSKYKNALLLFYFEEKSIKEASEYMNISEDYFKVLLHRGRSIIKNKLVNIIKKS